MAIQLSIVLPVFNEVRLLEATLRQLHATVAPLDLPYEIVCVDDGSTDGSTALLDALAASDPRLVTVHFTRNFGKEAALQAGLQAARGEAAVFMDADLQHPPELIPQMVELWAEGGFDVVEARKRRRGQESWLYRFFARSFGQLMAVATGADMLGASDFKLLSRAALDTVGALPERQRFFRGLVQWIGFESTSLEFDVEEREGGSTSWRPFQLVRYALDGILSFTTFPLVLIALAGLVTSGLGSILGCIAVYDYLTGEAVDGFTTVILLLVIFSGLILTSLGTMALYLGRLFEEVKGRPLYLIRTPAKTDPPPSGNVVREVSRR